MTRPNPKPEPEPILIPDIEVPVRLSHPILPHPRRPIRRGKPRPRFIPEAKGVWQFDASSEDSVGTNDFLPSSGSVAYKQFSRYELIPNTIVTRSGLKFEENKSYYATNNYAYSSNWTISFWWYSPGLVGFTKHATTRELESKVAPIFAIGNSQTISSQTVMNNATIAITEVGYSKMKNAIRVYLSQDGTTISQIITSEPYDAPGYHHILVTYLQLLGRFKIDIDGETGILYSAPKTSLQRTGKLRINEIAPGHISYKTTQTDGYLFDLLFSTYGSINNESLKAFRYGYEYISEETLFDTSFAYFGLAYSQPTTISTTQIFVDGGNIFAARSNGKIVKGARPVWDKEFSYPNTRSVAFLNTSKTDAALPIDKRERTIEWTTGGLKLKGVSVRI